MKECISALIDKRQVGEHRKLVLDDNYTVLPFVLPALIAPDKKEPLLILEKGRLHTPFDYHRVLCFVNPYPQFVYTHTHERGRLLQRILDNFLQTGNSAHESYLKAYFLFYPSMCQKGYKTKSITDDVKEIIAPIMKDYNFLTRDLNVPNVRENVLITFGKDGISLMADK